MPSKLIVFISCLLLSSLCEGKQRLPEQNSGPPCSRNFGPHNGACRTNVYAMVSTPEKFDSLDVNFVAYMAVHRGMLVLFPNEDSYRHYDEMVGIEIFGEHGKLQKFCTLWCYGYVLVRGKFFANDNPKTIGGRSGRIYDADISPAHPIPIDKKNREVMLRIDLDAETDTKRKE